MKKIIPILAIGLAGCASQSLETQVPIGISTSINGLQKSPCNCGGLESEESHKLRQKRKEEAAKTGQISTDIVEDDR
ncbi:hypothetical protein [uncultured Salinicola sp.]|uniref:hypothetical protein n=1 Tax=uncultured Salinicola sp. TaxID=1193542 RepID=UPI00262C92FA|nr:hypothetical protein [uncultured Salinicola sp.]